MRLKNGWKQSDVPSQVPESVRRALQVEAPAGDLQQQPQPAGSAELNAGWTAEEIPSQVPESIRQILAQGQPPPHPAAYVGKKPAQTDTSDLNGDLCDLLIIGGTIVDGTGADPWVGDVAVLDGVISAMAPSLAGMRALRTVDASGHIVTPGFVDIHTHYDGQITWDPYLSPSTQHGVTTVMFGNCGVGFAPCKPEAREKLIDVLEGVEDIPGSALHEGIQWSWETFPEYLDTLNGTATACDFAVLLPHVPLRVYVMGDRCDGVPTSEDLEQMRRVVGEAMAAGAIGFSTSRTLLHRDLNGTVIPGTYADRAELTALMAGMADGGGGIFEILEDFADLDVEQDWLSKLSQNFGIPVSFAFAAGNKSRQLEFNAFLDRVNKDSKMHGGEFITGQTSIKNQGSLQCLRSKYHPFVGHPTFESELTHLSYEDRLLAMRKPAMREQLLSEDSFFAGKPFSQVIFHPANLYPITDGANKVQYERNPTSESFQAIADATGSNPMALIYDALVAEKVLWAPLGRNPRQDMPVDMLKHPNVKVGLGDGGAHLGVFQEASSPTYMLTHYVRDRIGEKIPLAEAIRLQTMDTAHLLGMKDRGVLAVGLRADINIIDLDNLNLNVPYLADDLPSNASRWMQTADGYKMTILAGIVTFEDGQPTGALPGRLVRAPLRPHLNVTPYEKLDMDAIAGPEPKSTHDTMLAAEDLVGGASAMKTALNANTDAMKARAKAGATGMSAVRQSLPLAVLTLLCF